MPGNGPRAWEEDNPANNDDTIETLRKDSGCEANAVTGQPDC